MKFKIFAFVLLAVGLTSCYSYTAVVGTGSVTGQSVSKTNHYLIGGLVPVSVSDAHSMAGNAQNYVVKTQHSFVNGLLAIVTSGIYTPTTTTVTK